MIRCPLKQRFISFIILWSMSLQWAYAVTGESLQQDFAAFRLAVAQSMSGEPDWVKMVKEDVDHYQKNSGTHNLTELISRINYPAILLEHARPPHIFQDRFLKQILDASHMPTILDLENQIEEACQTFIPSSLKDSFYHLKGFYQQFREKFVILSLEERSEFFNEKALYTFPGSLLYAVSCDIARDRRNITEYGSQQKPPEASSNHIAIPRNGFYFKGDNSHTAIKPSLESGLYAFHRFFFGQKGVIPSSVMVLYNVPILESHDEKIRGKFSLQVIATPPQKTYQQYFAQHPGHNATFHWVKHAYALQVSQEVSGQRLDAYLKLEEGQTITQKIEALDEESFSALVLGSLLTRQSDYKPHNIMVDDYHCLVGIDNDAVFHSVFRKNRGHLSLDLKNILYFFTPLMDRPIHPGVRRYFMAIPTITFLQWVCFLYKQNHLYEKLKPLLKEPESLSLTFPDGTLAQLYNDIKKMVSYLHDEPTLTHNQLFKWLYPTAWECYQQIGKDKDPLTALEVLWNTNLEKAVNLSIKKEGSQTLRALIKQEARRGGEERESITDPKVHDMVKRIIAEIPFEEIKSCSPEVLKDVLEGLSSCFGEACLSHLNPQWREEKDLESIFLLKVLQGGLSSNIVNHLLGVFNLTPSVITLRFLLDPSFTGNAQDQLAIMLSRLSLDHIIGDHKTLLNWVLDQGHLTLLPLIMAKEGGGLSANPTLALKGYQLFQKKQPLLNDGQRQSIAEVFRLLQTQNASVRWAISHAEIFFDRSVWGGDNALDAYGTQSGERRLAEIYCHHLFTSTTTLHPGVADGNHKVIPILTHTNPLQNHLYFKFLTEFNDHKVKSVGALPGMEEAISVFIRKMVPEGAPYSELFILFNKLGCKWPVLVSQGVEGRTLRDVLEKDPSILHHLEPKRLSYLLLATMLINPEDGKRDNYILALLPGGHYQIVCIDNERAFVPPVAADRATIKVCSKSVLFCLDHMSTPVHPEVIAFWKDINPLTFLEEWLIETKIIHDKQKNLLAHYHLSSFETSHGIRLGVFFKEGAMGYLYNKILRLQRVLDKPVIPTHLEVLQKVEPLLYRRYEQVLKKPLSVSDRFKEADSAYFEYIQGSERTLSSIHSVLHQSGVPTGKDEFGPSSALSEVKAMQQKMRDKILMLLALKQGEHFDVSKDHDVEELLSKTDFKEIALPDQRNIMQSLQKRQLTHLALSDVRVSLMDCFFKDHLYLGYLSGLELRDCAEINDDLFLYLAQCPLRTLILKRAKIQKIEEKTGVFSTRPFVFPDLQRLDLTGCVSLTVLSLIAPCLEEVVLKGCDALPMQQFEGIRTLIENSSQLKKIIHTSLNAFIEEEGEHEDLNHYALLFSLLREHFYLKSGKELVMEGRRLLQNPLNLQKSYLLYHLMLRKEVEKRIENFLYVNILLAYYRDLGASFHKTAEALPHEQQEEKIKQYDKAIELKEKVINLSGDKATPSDYRALALALYSSAENLPEGYVEEKEKRKEESIEILESLLKKKKFNIEEERVNTFNMLRRFKIIEGSNASDFTTSFKRIVPVCLMGVCMGHYSAIKKALYNLEDYNDAAPIGVDLNILEADKNTRFHFYQLGENERFHAIGAPFLESAKALIFHFGWGCGGDYEIIKNYIKFIKGLKINNIPKILLGIGNGDSEDLSDILKIKQESEIETLIYLPWCKKPYQYAYIRDKICALTLGDQEKAQEVTIQYEERKRQEKEESLKQIASIMHHKSMSFIELRNYLSDIDYTDLGDLLQKEISVLKLERKRDETSSFFTNIKHLFYVGLVENNQKIIESLKLLITSSTSQEELFPEDSLLRKYEDNPNATLCRICASGFLPAVQYLISKGADALLGEDDPSRGGPPINYAVKHVHIIQWLAQNNYLTLQLKNDIISESAKEGYQDTMEYILTQGADINYSRKNGETPLYLAASKGHEALSRFLITKGAHRKCTISTYDKELKKEVPKTIDIVTTFSIEE
jgi:hypothetical protein